MAHNLCKELDALMKAETEQMPEWHAAMDKPGDLNLFEIVPILAGWVGIHRRAILRLAEEIDRLGEAVEPES
jgi:hypothetical protein